LDRLKWITADRDRDRFALNDQILKPLLRAA